MQASEQPPPPTVVVVGGGTMGSGIAQAFLQAGADVVVREIDEARAARTRSGLERGLRRWADKQSDRVLAERALSRLLVTPDVPPTPGPDLVVESVPESLELKQAVLRELSQLFPESLLGTNTSALSVDLLSESVVRPERFLGLHFFNPVPSSLLVELVKGRRTSPESLVSARAYVERLGKSSIEVRNSPGFATSRLGITIGLEAIRMLEEGVASAEDIDQGMVLGYKFPIGPLELSDLVGLDVRLAIAEHLFRELGARFEPPALLRTLVADGRLGRKSGQGFYDWGEDDRATGPAPWP